MILEHDGLIIFSILDYEDHFGNVDGLQSYIKDNFSIDKSEHMRKKLSCSAADDRQSVWGDYQYNNSNSFFFYDKNINEILGFFTLSLKSIDLSEFSNRDKKKLSPKNRSSKFPVVAFCIEYLAKNSKVDDNYLNLNFMVNIARLFINECTQIIRCNLIILEAMMPVNSRMCLIERYQECGFETFGPYRKVGETKYLNNIEEVEKSEDIFVQLMGMKI